MSESRDIDEILASLDALLREGNPLKEVAPTKAAPFKADSGAPESADSAGNTATSNPVSAASEVHVLAQNKIDKHDKQQKNKGKNNKPTHTDANKGHNDRLTRLLLTKDMLVKKPQVLSPKENIAEKLPEKVSAFALQEADIKKTLSKQNDLNIKVVREAVQVVEINESAMLLQKKDIERLLALVSRDISNHLQKSLPKLINKSLHVHLLAMQGFDKNKKT